jgi:hypothetical protein
VTQPVMHANDPHVQVEASGAECFEEAGPGVLPRVASNRWDLGRPGSIGVFERPGPNRRERSARQAQFGAVVAGARYLAMLVAIDQVASARMPTK